jgi:hypothetical protein
MTNFVILLMLSLLALMDWHAFAGWKILNLQVVAGVTQMFHQQPQCM